MELSVEELEQGAIIGWSEVSQIHRIRNGIYQRNGRLISLLTDLGRLSRCYPDVADNDVETVLYTGAGRRGNQKLDVYNRAMLEAVKNGAKVPLFCKHEVNRWEYMGQWSVIDSEYVFEEKNQRMIWRFVLRRADLKTG